MTIGHEYIGRDYIGHNYVCKRRELGLRAEAAVLLGAGTVKGLEGARHKYIGHEYMGHNYIGHNSLLRGWKVLVMDEATANVDQERDDFIQTKLRELREVTQPSGLLFSYDSGIVV